MLFEIKSKLNGSVLFSLECGSLKLCLEAAVMVPCAILARIIGDQVSTSAQCVVFWAASWAFLLVYCTWNYLAADRR